MSSVDIAQNAGDAFPSVQLTLDGGIAAFATTLPFWLRELDGWVAALLPVLAFILIAYRIVDAHMAVRHRKERYRRDKGT